MSITIADIDAAIHDGGMVFNHCRKGRPECASTISADEAATLAAISDSGTCNRMACQIWMDAANAQGKTADEVAVIVRLMIGDTRVDPQIPPDKQAMRDFLAGPQ